MQKTPPRWDLTNVYPGLDSPNLAGDIQWVKDATDALFKLYQEELSGVDASSEKAVINNALSKMVDRMNELYLKASTIGSYLHSFVATDSFNQQAKQMSSQFDQVVVGIQKTEVLVESWVGKFKEVLPEVLALGGSAGEHAFPIKEIAEQINT